MQLNPGDTPPVVCPQVLANPRRSKRRHQRQRYRSRADVPTNCGSPSGSARIGRSLGSACRNRRQRFSQKNSRDPSREFSTSGRTVAITVPTGLMLSQMRELVRQVHNALTEPWNKGVVARNRGLYRATEIARIFGRTVRRSSLRDISPLTVLSFVASLADRAGRGGEVRADCGRGHRPGPGSSVPGRRHHHAVLVLCRERRAVEPQALHHRVQRPTGLPARRRRHLHLRPAAGMHPRRERHFATTPVAEIVAHSGGGIVDKGAEASAMAKRLIVCCDGTWNTPN